MTHPSKPVRLIVSLTALFLGWVQVHSLAHAQSQPSSAKPQKQVLFEDKSDRDEVGERYEVLEPDPNRPTMNDGQLLIVAINPPKNLVLTQKTFSGEEGIENAAEFGAFAVQDAEGRHLPAR